MVTHFSIDHDQDFLISFTFVLHPYVVQFKFDILLLLGILLQLTRKKSLLLIYLLNG